MEELNLGHHPRKDLIHKELQLRMPKESYENLNEKNKLLFLAGLFDGEGSFGVWGKGNGRKSFQCSVEMCDCINAYTCGLICTIRDAINAMCADICAS